MLNETLVLHKSDYFRQIVSLYALGYYSRMADINETEDSQASILCKSCGLCCTGHLFIWVKLRPSELDPAEALGMHVLRSEPRQRGFNQPCPLWLGQCTIYTSPNYPHACRSYKCKLLKEVIGKNTLLPDALTVIEHAKEIIRELESQLPASKNVNFRERLVAHIDTLENLKTPSDKDFEFRSKADELLIFYEQVFGVNDVIDQPNDE